MKLTSGNFLGNISLLIKEDVGFEPTRRFTDLTVFKTVPFSQTWVILRNILCTKLQERDSNPRPSGYEPDKLPLLHPAIIRPLSEVVNP